MKKFFLMIIPLPFVFVSCGQKVKNNIIYVTEVHDGDTLKDSNGITYRILGADTPEVSYPPEWRPTTGLETVYGKLATQFTRNLLLDKKVRIRKIKMGIHGRQVAQIYVTSTNKTLSEMLVEKGLARVAYISKNHTNSKYHAAPDYYFDDEEYIKRLYDKQLYAAGNHLGFWKDIDHYNIIFPKSK